MCIRDRLQTAYDILEDEVGDIDAVQAEREECEEERDALQEKVDTLTHHIEELINQYYQRYIKTEEIIPKLEKLIWKEPGPIRIKGAPGS